MTRHLATLTFIVVLLNSPMAVAEPNISGKWESSLWWIRVETTIKQEGANISGVAQVYVLNGPPERYTFNGHIHDGRVQATHKDGHAFSGKLNSAGQLNGFLTLASGQEVWVVASRR
ncbi:MAG TPA: hypothetical protein VMC85_18725 [Desulfomonilaceae bacterium]|nr:hypothetical protein [Desulfomonilaceae bacterium]